MGAAFGTDPRAFTAGSARDELDKRLAAELVEASPVLFLDNVNGTSLRSDLLASVLTERPARVRLLGKTTMALLNSTAFIIVTGNGLSVSEDLVRRFILCELDAKMEDPEARKFPSGFVNNVKARRGEVLSAALTIWRFGRQNRLPAGQALGSYEEWCAWVRDPLLALGCRDPVDRIQQAKALDPRRQRFEAIFEDWWNTHGDKPMRAAELADSIKSIIDPQGRGRQWMTVALSKMDGMRSGGFVPITRQKSTAKWSAATYRLEKTTQRDYCTDP